MDFLNNFNISLGRWFRVPVMLHWSFVLMWLFIAVINPMMGIAYLGMFFIVLLHECGHCLAGQYYGCRIRDIVLYPFGGAASMEVPTKPLQELVVALAGPAVNVALLPVLWPLADLHSILGYLAIANTALLVFNLVPAFPMDGGRVLRATLSWLWGNRLRATEWAVFIGKGFCILFAILAVCSFNFVLLFIAFMIFMAAEGELQIVRRQESGVNDAVSESAQMLREIRERLDEIDANRDRNRR